MEPKIPLYGLSLQSELSVSQFVIPAGAGATVGPTNPAVPNNLLVTFNAAHGLTMTPAPGIMPNYFISFGGVGTVLTGTGVLVGNIFRILSIPSTTTIVIYSTVLTATVTALTGIPVFLPPFSAGGANLGIGGPTQYVPLGAVYPPVGGAYVTQPQVQVGQCALYYSLGANCAIQYNSDLTFIPLDASTGPTPAVAPVFRPLAVASSSGDVIGAGASLVVFANGTTATSRFSVHN